jgi:hypothetical protein
MRLKSEIQFAKMFSFKKLIMVLSIAAIAHPCMLLNITRQRGLVLNPKCIFHVCTICDCELLPSVKKSDLFAQHCNCFSTSFLFRVACCCFSGFFSDSSTHTHIHIYRQTHTHTRSMSWKTESRYVVLHFTHFC